MPRASGHKGLSWLRLRLSVVHSRIGSAAKARQVAQKGNPIVKSTGRHTVLCSESYANTEGACDTIFSVYSPRARTFVNYRCLCSRSRFCHGPRIPSQKVQGLLREEGKSRNIGHRRQENSQEERRVSSSSASLSRATAVINATTTCYYTSRLLQRCRDEPGVATD